MDWPLCYNHVFAVMRRRRDCGQQRWEACCPAHEDQHQSLSVAIGAKGTLMVRCHAGHGCSVEAIVRAWGLGIDDLFPDNKKAGGKGGKKVKFICAYDYRDEKGKLLMQTVRWEPKHFTQRRPNPKYDPKLPRNKETNPDFLNDTQGVRRVLYKLPELLQAIGQKPDRFVFILEGEKDVDLAWKQGIVATTAPMGAGKWKDEYSDFLHGCHVVVIPDEDPFDEKAGFRPGLHHAEQVCDSLVKVAKSVRLLHLPLAPDEKKDFTDWWHGAEGTANDKKKQLGVYVQSCPLWPKKPEPAASSQQSAISFPPTGKPAVPTSVQPTVNGNGAPADDAAAPNGNVLPQPRDNSGSTTGEHAGNPWHEGERQAVQEEARADTPKAAGEISEPMQETMQAVEQLTENGVKFRTVAEWFGFVHMELVTLNQLVAKGGDSAVGQAALGLAAVLVKGVEDLHSLRQVQEK